ncbi:MAG: DUF1214 domain-containing protein [Steroidobacteraceae bacterium]
MNTSVRPSPATTSPVLKAAWDKYLATLDQIRADIEASQQFDFAPDQRGLAYRQLMQIQAMAYNFAVGPRPIEPRAFHNTGWQTEFYSIGGNGPDFDYRVLFLDGGHTYRLTGQLNDAKMTVTQVNSATPGQPQSRCLANYDFANFEVKPDTSFEIILSAKKHDGNWMELLPDADYHWMMIRPTLETWDAKPPEFQIERISPRRAGDVEVDEFSEAALARRIELATSFARYAMTDWSIGYTQLVLRNAGGFNKFTNFNTVEAGELGSPAAQYYQCVYQVNDDEALIIELDDMPNGEYWSFQLFDLWQNSHFFRTRQSALNLRQIERDADGKYRIVLSRQDPGIANWLDNAGFNHGQVLWRNYKSKQNTEHRVHRVKFNELSKHLASGVRRVSPEERVRAIAERRNAYRRRHGE